MRLPDDLVELDQRFGLWRRERVGERETKVPYSISGRKVSVTDLSAWSSYDEASKVLAANQRLYAGLAFLLVKSDGIVGMDMDDALDESGDPKPWARGPIERFADTYAEISPSGVGIKIWARGSLPANLPGVRVGDGSIELYDHARYFTVTGRVFRGAPLQVEDHSADLLLLYERLVGARPGKKVWPLQPVDGGRIPHGQQHSTLVSIAGTLRARRVCEEAILSCLLEINRRQCEKPGPVANIERIVHSTRTWGAR